MLKRLSCILLSLALLLSFSFALAEDTQAEGPVLLVTVNGQEIRTDNDYLVYMQSNYLNWAASNGYDTGNEALAEAINRQALNDTVIYCLILQKGKEQGLDQVTDEEKAAFTDSAKEQWEGIVSSFVASLGTVTDESTDEEKAAARADAEALLQSQYGYDENMYIAKYLEQAVNNTVYTRLVERLTEGMTVTDADVQAYYDNLVKNDQEKYGGDISAYEFYVTYYGQSSYYTPEGYRGINHILLKVEDELLNNWKDLSTKLEGQQSGTETESAEEPVTEEMVAEARRAVLDSVKETVDEIKAKLDGGASFDDLIREYGTDPGMEKDETRAIGYPVHKDSIIYDKAFRDAAMALEKVGDVSEPVVGQYGVHILQYLRDVPAGAAELTEEMKDEFGAAILKDMQAEALNSAVDQWRKDSDIVYTEAGESWKMPETETAE